MACNFVVDGDGYETAEEVDAAPTITLLLYRLLCSTGAHAEVLAIPARRRMDGRLVRMVREVMMVRPVVVVSSIGLRQ